MWHIWLILSGIFFILEIFTLGFLVFWLGVASLITMLVSFFTDNIMVQVTVFLVSSSLLIFFTKPLIDKFLKNKKPVITNAFTIIGKEALVIEDIDPIKGTGQINVAGEIWSAMPSDSDMIIPKGSKVEIEGINGVRACVRQLPSNKFSGIENQ